MFSPVITLEVGKVRNPRLETVKSPPTGKGQVRASRSHEPGNLGTTPPTSHYPFDRISRKVKDTESIKGICVLLSKKEM